MPKPKGCVRAGSLNPAGENPTQKVGQPEALAFLLNLLVQTLETVGLSKEQVLCTVANFIDQLPSVLKERLLFVLPEREQRPINLDGLRQYHHVRKLRWHPLDLCLF